MDELSRAKEAAKVKSTEERIKRTAERTEAVYTKLDGLAGREVSVMDRLNELENAMKISDDRQTEIVNYLQEIAESLAALRQEKSESKPIEIYEPLAEEEEASTSTLPEIKVGPITRSRTLSVSGTGNEPMPPSSRKPSSYRKESMFALRPRSASIFKRPSNRKRSDYFSITDAIVVQDIDSELQANQDNRLRAISGSTDGTNLELSSIKREDSTGILESEDNLDYSTGNEEENESVENELEHDADNDNSSTEDRI